MEEENKKIKKNNIKTIRGKALTAYIVVIIVISIALAYGCGFLLGKELYDKKEKNNNNPTPIEKEELLTDEAVKNIMDRYEGIKISSERLYANDKFEISSIDNNELLVTALSKFKVYNVCAKTGLNYILLSDINNELNKYVQKSLTMDDIKNNPSPSMGNPYDYAYSIKSADNERVKVSSNVCGGEFGAEDYVYRHITKGTKNGDYAYIYEKIAFARYGKNFDYDGEYYVDYYKDYIKTGDKVETIPSKEFTDANGNPKEGSTPNWDLYNTYKYTFKLVDGAYYFQSIELVK